MKRKISCHNVRMITNFPGKVLMIGADNELSCVIEFCASFGPLQGV
jgi:hypothetical protein